MAGLKHTHRDRRAATLAYRRHYRRRLMPRGYSGRRHLALVLLSGTAVLALLACAFPEAFAWCRLWVVPATLVVASFVEYWAHRGPMHNAMPLLGEVFDRHTRQHHRYFTPAAMRVHAPRDLCAVLFPAPMLLFFGLIAATLGAFVALLISREVAVVFVATALAYYLLYELLHLAYHLPNTLRVARWPIVRQLAHLHRLHHARSAMREVNFNLVLPLFDWLFGTLAWRERHRERFAPPSPAVLAMAARGNLDRCRTED